MATIHGVDLDLGGPFRAGAAFRCTEADVEARVVDVAEGERVELCPQEGLVMAKLQDPVETGYADAHEAAQKALDITAYLGGPSLSLIAAHDEVVQWWTPPDADGPLVRAVVTREVGITIGASVNVLGPDGLPRDLPEEAAPSWTPALRFFRYAQLSDDVFEAYRNMYLGLEAALSELVSDAPRTERAWLAHSLRTVAAERAIDLSRYVTSAAADAVASFLEEQYEALRCATFHAKRDRKALLPGSVEERELVASALEHLAQLVLALAEPTVGGRRMSGAMTPIGFESLFIAPKVGNLEMQLLRRDRGAVVESIPMPSRYLGHVPDDRSEQYFSAELPAERLAGREFDGVRVIASGGEGLAASAFDETFNILPIELSGAESVEILLVFVLRNLQLPRTRFPR